MTLDKTQIQRIYDQLATHNLHYEDLRCELTDHVASAVEHRLEDDEADLDSMIKEVIAEVNPEKVQRQRMLASLLLPLRAFRQLHLLKTLLIFLCAALAVQLSLSLFDTLTSANKWLSVILIILATLPALLSVADQRAKPYKMSFFMSAVLGCHLAIYGLHSINVFLLEDYLNQSSLATLAFYAFGFGMIMLTYHSIYQQYQKVKQYASH